MARNNTASKLIGKLRDISKGAPVPLGFGRAPAAQQLASLALVVELARNEPTLAEAALKAGADAVLARLHSEGAGGITFGGLAEERDRLAAILAVAAGGAVGVTLGASGVLESSDLAQLGRMGVDFVLAYPYRLPVDALHEDTPGLVVRLDSDYSNAPLRALGELAIGAVQFTTARPDGSLPIFTVHDLAAYRQALDPIRPPVIASLPWPISVDDLAYLRGLGIAGVVLGASTVGDVPADVQVKVADFQRAIVKLGPPLGRDRAQGGRMAVVPRVSARTSEELGEEPDET